MSYVLANGLQENFFVRWFVRWKKCFSYVVPVPVVNPLNLRVSISILLTGCHTFVAVLAGRSCSNIKSSFLVIISLILDTCALNRALLLQGEI